MTPVERNKLCAARRLGPVATPPPGRPVTASIIIPCKNEGHNVKMTVDSILEATPVNRNVEIIVVDDASGDGCCYFLKKNGKYDYIKLLSTPGLGAACARNLGASAARGEYLIFCDAHITVPKGWPGDLLDAFGHTEAGAASPAIGALANPAAAGYGQTWNERLEVEWLPPPPGMEAMAVPLLPGGCLAVRTTAFHAVEGFDSGFIVWGHEDVELSLKLWLFGYSLYTVPTVKILHHFRDKHPYPVKLDHVHYNLLRMAYSHFNEERIGKVLDLIGSGRNKISARVLKGGAIEQRRHYFARRKYNDDWFMNKFGIAF